MAGFFDPTPINPQPMMEPQGFDLLRQFLMSRIMQGASNPYGMSPQGMSGLNGPLFQNSPNMSALNAFGYNFPSASMGMGGSGMAPPAAAGQFGMPPRGGPMMIPPRQDGSYAAYGGSQPSFHYDGSRNSYLRGLKGNRNSPFQGHQYGNRGAFVGGTEHAQDGMDARSDPRTTSRPGTAPPPLSSQTNQYAQGPTGDPYLNYMYQHFAGINTQPQQGPRMTTQPGHMGRPGAIGSAGGPGAPAYGIQPTGPAPRFGRITPDPFWTPGAMTQPRMRTQPMTPGPFPPMQTQPMTAAPPMGRPNRPPMISTFPGQTGQLDGTMYDGSVDATLAGNLLRLFQTQRSNPGPSHDGLLSPDNPNVMALAGKWAASANAPQSGQLPSGGGGGPSDVAPLPQGNPWAPTLDTLAQDRQKAADEKKVQATQDQQTQIQANQAKAETEQAQRDRYNATAGQTFWQKPAARQTGNTTSTRPGSRTVRRDGSTAGRPQASAPRKPPPLSPQMFAVMQMLFKQQHPQAAQQHRGPGQGPGGMSGSMSPDQKLAAQWFWNQHLNPGGGWIGRDTTPGGGNVFMGMSRNNQPVGYTGWMQGGNPFITGNNALDQFFGRPGATSQNTWLSDIYNQEGVRDTTGLFAHAPFSAISGGTDMRYAPGAAGSYADFFNHAANMYGMGGGGGWSWGPFMM